MSLSWLLTNISSAVLLPPLNLVILAAAGFLLRKTWPRLSVALCLGSLATLVVLSTNAGARLIIAPLEKLSTPLTAAQTSSAQTIVILGGGRIHNAPEYDRRDSPALYALARLRYGAKLHRETGLPILVTGGAPDGASESEAAVMARVLREDFKVPVTWLEQESHNTAQNAQLSAAMLKKAGAQRILLVTDAMHMPRSEAIFRRYGFQVVPAPTVFLTRKPLAPIDFVPKGSALKDSHYAMHEWIGICWYRLRHGAGLEKSFSD